MGPSGGLSKEKGAKTAQLPCPAGMGGIASKPDTFPPEAEPSVAAPDSRSRRGDAATLKGIGKELPKFLALQWLKCYHFYSCNRDEVPGPSRSINLEIY